MQQIIQEVSRFFGNLFNNMITRMTYDAENAAEQKVRDIVNKRFERKQSDPQEEDEHN